MRVRNFIGKNGAIKNQFVIENDGVEIFQSYNSAIVKKDNGKIFLDASNWDYSKTTGKYRDMYLGETKRETESKIKSGEYILCNLN